MTPDKHLEDELVRTLLEGKLAVIRTDTIYGIVARAADEQAVKKLYKARNRSAQKSCVVLVSSANAAYGSVGELRRDIAEHSGRPTSFLIPADNAPVWLLRENNLLAYRVPNVAWLKRVLKRTGPLIAPSANPEGLPPARTIAEARDYFGNKVACYVDGGVVPANYKPSSLVRIHRNGSIERLR